MCVRVRACVRACVASLVHRCVSGQLSIPVPVMVTESITNRVRVVPCKRAVPPEYYRVVCNNFSIPATILLGLALPIIHLM